MSKTDENIDRYLDDIAELLASGRIPYAIDHPHLSIGDLSSRGWSRGMIQRLLPMYDRRDPVGHYFDYRGKNMYALDRVERIESLPRFEFIFRNSAKWQRLSESFFHDVIDRCAVLRTLERWQQPLPAWPTPHAAIAKYALLVEEAKSHG